VPKVLVGLNAYHCATRYNCTDWASFGDLYGAWDGQGQGRAVSHLSLDGGKGGRWDETADGERGRETERSDHSWPLAPTHQLQPPGRSPSILLLPSRVYGQI